MLAPAKIGNRLISAAQIAGVLATAWFVWTTGVLARPGVRPIGPMILQALFYVALAWLCAAALAFWVYTVVSLADLPRAARFALRTAAPAMWFAPAIILLSAPATAAFAVSLFLVVNATRQLISQWTTIDSPISRTQPAPTRHVPFISAGADTGPLPLTVLMGSFAAQAGLVAKLWGHPLSAAILFALSMAILTSLAVASGAYRPEKPAALPHSALSVVWTFLLAAALTLGGISVRGALRTASEAGSDAANPAGPAGPAAHDHDMASPAVDAGAAGDFPGVVLLPPLKPQATLIVPVLAPSLQSGAPLIKPLGIPFSGEYWMFRWPAKRPPPGATVRRGAPSELSFHTPDGWPMEMEAHQRLDPPLSTNCCSAIRLAVRNTDDDPQTVLLMELVLMDSQAPNRILSLGTPLIESLAPPEQTWTFRLPPAISVPSFDEIKVVFHRPRWRQDKSARIAIERFVLMP